MSPLQLVCVAVLLLGATFASVVVHRPCDGHSQNWCSINHVRIDPCKDPMSCRLKKESFADISFDFTPKFHAKNLTAGLFWVSGNGDVPFPELDDANACQFTSCPTKSGKSQALNYGLWLNKMLPEGTFVFKWKLWNKDDENQVCCFEAQVRIRD